MIDNWQNGTGELVWKNGTNELCWRDANWTPATAAVGCDGALVPAAAALPLPAAATGCCRRPPRRAAAAAASKVTFAADAFFDFDKSVLKPEGRAKLDDLVSKIKDVNLEVIIAVGHTDSIGSDAYNQTPVGASCRSCQGLPGLQGHRTQPRLHRRQGREATCRGQQTKEGRAKNRRVEIEVVGTRANR